jgi:hypothetical protein
MQGMKSRTSFSLPPNYMFSQDVSQLSRKLQLLIEAFGGSIERDMSRVVPHTDIQRASGSQQTPARRDQSAEAMQSAKSSQSVEIS